MEWWQLDFENDAHLRLIPKNRANWIREKCCVQWMMMMANGCCNQLSACLRKSRLHRQPLDLLLWNDGCQVVTIHWSIRCFVSSNLSWASTASQYNCVSISSEIVAFSWPGQKKEVVVMAMRCRRFEREERGAHGGECTFNANEMVVSRINLK